MHRAAAASSRIKKTPNFPRFPSPSPVLLAAAVPLRTESSCCCFTLAHEPAAARLRRERVSGGGHGGGAGSGRRRREHGLVGAVPALRRALLPRRARRRRRLRRVGRPAHQDDHVFRILFLWRPEQNNTLQANAAIPHKCRSEERPAASDDSCNHICKAWSDDSCSHGPAFRDWMDAINTCLIEDYARPIGGYCITTTHDFSQEKSCNIQGFLWKCESCGDTLVRAKSLGPPSDFCCIENVSQPATCCNRLCHWHNHKMDCRGTYVVTKPAVTPGQKMAPKGTLRLRTETTKMFKSQQGAVQQSYPDSDEVQENGSLKKAGKRNIPEDFQKAIVLSAAPRRKPKQELVAWAKREHLLSNNATSPGSSSSKKADDSQKAIVPSAAPRSRRLKRKQASVTSEEHEILSPWSCNNANSSRSNTSRKEVQKSSVQPCASQKKLKLEQGLVTLEKHISRPAAPQSTLKQPTKTNSSMKSRKQHQPEDFPRITVQPAVPLTRSKRKQSLAAPERQAARSEARGSAEEKEYVCFSLWQNFYESECSSGSAEPLVNKRTVRRKKERERLVQIAHSRSIKARPDEEVSSGQTKPPPLHLEVIVIDDEVMTEAPSMDVLAPRADQVVTQAPRAGGQSQPPAPSMDIAAVAPADHRDRSDPSTSMDIAAAAPADKVMTQAHADQPQPPAPCSIAADQVPPPHSVDPPGLTPSNPRSWPAVIDISDDDDD